MMASWAKMAPAIGALNEAEIAAATPQPSSTRKPARVRPIDWPKMEATVAPSCTAGP